MKPLTEKHVAALQVVMEGESESDWHEAMRDIAANIQAQVEKQGWVFTLRCPDCHMPMDRLSEGRGSDATGYFCHGCLMPYDLTGAEQ